MSDLIRKSDADAAIVACKGNGATRQACRDAIAALPAVAVVPIADVLKVKTELRQAQERLAALEPVAAPDLTDPVVVHANMLRGTIAKPTIEQIIHLYGVDALVAALAPVIVREAGIEPVAAPDPAAIREGEILEHIEHAKRLRRYDWQEWTAQDIEDAEGIICAFLALIQKGATDDRA